ncbi:MAG: hypothetical protein EBX41_03755 [Chitinophagia bacterium]|nr:hypothetical protein [Chitinophagia bacterium]
MIFVKGDDCYDIFFTKNYHIVHQNLKNHSSDKNTTVHTKIPRKTLYPNRALLFHQYPFSVFLQNNSKINTIFVGK